MKCAIAILAGLFVSTTFNAAAAEGDAEAGEKVFRKCKACHVVESDQNRVGPSLQGLIGRQPGTVDGFKYSNAMIEFGDGKIWDEELLTVYLAKPREMVKGTRMAFAGLRKDEEIADIIAYLKQYSPSE